VKYCGLLKTFFAGTGFIEGGFESWSGEKNSIPKSEMQDPVSF